MKKIYQLAAVLALTVPIIYPTVNQATAQVVEEQKTDKKEDLSTRIQKVHDYAMNNEKADKLVFEAFQGKTVIAKYNYNDKDYLIAAFDPNKEDVTGKDLEKTLLVVTHKSYEEEGEYLLFSNVGLISEILGAEQIFHTSVQIEDFLTFETIITGTFPLLENQVLRRKTYISGAGQMEARGEEYQEFFAAEFEKTIDEILDFYTQE